MKIQKTTISNILLCIGLSTLSAAEDTFTLYDGVGFGLRLVGGILFGLINSFDLILIFGGLVVISISLLFVVLLVFIGLPLSSLRNFLK